MQGGEEAYELMPDETHLMEPLTERMTFAFAQSLWKSSMEAASAPKFGRSRMCASGGKFPNPLGNPSLPE